VITKAIEMKLYNLVKAGMIPVTDLKIPLSTLSYSLPEQIGYFLNSQMKILNSLDIARISKDYLEGNKVYKMTGKLHETIYSFRKGITFEKVLRLAHNFGIYKQYSLLEACFLAELSMKEHVSKKCSEMLILLESDCVDPIPTLCIRATNFNKYNIYFANTYHDMLCSPGNSIVFRS
jgi:hypothetical protein